MVFFVRITVNQSHLRPICKSTKFNPKIQRTIYSINFQRLRLHVLGFIRTVVPLNITTMVNQNVALSELSVDEMTTTEGGFFVEAGLILLLLIAGTQKAF